MEHCHLLKHIPEIQRLHVTYEECVGGQAFELVFVVTDEKYACDNEGGRIGYVLSDEGANAYFGSAIKFVSDGNLYTHKINEFDVEQIVGKFKLALFRRKMKAIEELLNATYDLERYVVAYEAVQSEQEKAEANAEQAAGEVQ